MHHLRISVALAALLGAAAACDGSDTVVAAGTGVVGGASNGSGSTTLDQHASNTATDPPPNTATQPAPNTATQTAPRTATHPAPNTATQPPNNGMQIPDGGGSAVPGCMSACEHAASLGCDDDEQDMTCSELCSLMQMVAACQSSAQTLMGCAAAASSCEALDSCGDDSGWFDCVEDALGSSSNPPPTTGNVTISDPENCNTATTCGGCEATCDACICTLQLVGTPSAQIQSTCSAACL